MLPLIAGYEHNSAVISLPLRAARYLTRGQGKSRRIPTASRWQPRLGSRGKNSERFVNARNTRLPGHSRHSREQDPSLAVVSLHRLSATTVRDKSRSDQSPPSVAVKRRKRVFARSEGPRHVSRENRAATCRASGSASRGARALYFSSLG